LLLLLVDMRVVIFIAALYGGAILNYCLCLCICSKVKLHARPKSKPFSGDRTIGRTSLGAYLGFHFRV
jgi:hypothetical protein